jgi:uncharacterized protein (TIGR03437 family)
LNGPAGIAVDAAGNLYIADSYNDRIRQVSPNGIITTVAGNGTFGFSGDGGPATSAELNDPTGLAVDAAGNLYIADSNNNRIREVSPSGIITTVAGNGTAGYSGDGGPATSAQLNVSMGLAADAAGNLYIADYTDNRVRKVSPGGTITTVSGNGVAGFSGDGGLANNAQLHGPHGLAVDAAGNLYIVDTGNNRIRAVSPSSIITTIAGNGTFEVIGDGGLATNAQLAAPSGVAKDAAGNLYIADSGNNRVREVTPSGIISTFAGNGTAGFFGDGGPAVNAQLSDAHGLTLDAAGNLYFADSGNNRVRKVTSSGIISTVAGNGTAGFSGDGGPATSAQLSSPTGLALDAAGNLYIADSGNNRVRQVSASGAIITFAGNGNAGFYGDGDPASTAALKHPEGVAVDAAGNVFIADTQNQRVREVSSSGVITTVAGNIAGAPVDYIPATSAWLAGTSAVAVDAADNLYIATNSSVHKVSAGIIVTIAGINDTIQETGTVGYSGDGGPATGAKLNNPAALAVDAAGNVYVADAGNGAIRLLQPTGSVPAPAVSVNGVVDAAAFRAPVTAGGIASVFGTNLGSVITNAFTVPLPNAIEGATVTIGGRTAPLFFVSPTQINFQVPWELSGQTQTTLQVTTPAGTSGPLTVSLSTASASIFTLDSSGGGQGVVTISNTGQLAVAATPAPRGQYITIYCTGLGTVSNPPATGATAVADPVSSTVANATVTIGGVPATVNFAGLAPGFVGLYQVNALVPSSVSPGSAVSLVLIINGASSNIATIAVQ